MARFLFATQPITGHLLPAMPIVRSLLQRGHEVRWYTGRKFQSRIETLGAGFEPFRSAYDYDDHDYDAAFPGRGKLKGLSQIKFDFTNIFMKQIGPQHRDLEAIQKSFRPDVLVADPTFDAALTLHAKGGPPFAIYNVTCLGIRSCDTAPFGLGLPPSATLLGRLRNRLLYGMASNVIFRQATLERIRQRRALDVEPARFGGVLNSPFLFLQPTVQGFEYPLSDLPPQVHFIGALLPDAPASFTPPAWWPEAMEKKRPVVLVTQGTVATDVRELIKPALEGLASVDALIIAAGVKSPSDLGLSRIPENARVETFVPFKPLLPAVDVYVTNGGFGGVHYALANGVPVVAGGTTEDKPEICNRIAYAGAGVNLKTGKPKPKQVREAVTRVLKDPSYRAKAQGLKSQFDRLDAQAEAARLLEKLAETKRPVLAG